MTPSLLRERKEAPPELQPRRWWLFSSHSRTVGRMMKSFGQFLGWDEARVREAEWTGRLHDIGKSLIAPAIFLKAEKLSPVEWEVVRLHPVWGAELVADWKKNRQCELITTPLIQAVRFHHERWDGRGYYNLQRNHIPLLARMIGLADAFDAMTALDDPSRAYRAAATVPEALEEIRRSAGSHFDPELAVCFAEMISLRNK